MSTPPSTAPAHVPQHLVHLGPVPGARAGGGQQAQRGVVGRQVGLDEVVEETEGLSGGLVHLGGWMGVGGDLMGWRAGITLLGQLEEVGWGTVIA